MRIRKIALVVMLTLFAALNLSAQQKRRTSNMTITIYEFHGIRIGKFPNMIITRDDSLQEQKNLDLNLHVKAKDQLAAHEQAIMQALKPYYDGGWKLISTSVEVSIFQGGDFDKTYRYYLSREQQ